MLRGIPTPRTPFLGSRLELVGCRPSPSIVCQRAQQADVRGGKGIRLAQLTQGDVLRRPFANPAYRAKLLDGLGESTVCPEEIRIGDDRSGDC